MANLLEELRKKRDKEPFGRLTELARRLKWHPSVLSDILNGKRPLTTKRLKTIMKEFPELRELCMRAIEEHQEG